MDEIGRDVRSRRLGPRACHAVFLALAMAFPPSMVRAQTLDLTIREQSRNAPAAGAIVKVVRDGKTVYMGLANEWGRIVFGHVAAGSYRIRADRIGFGGVLTEPFDVPNDPAWVDHRSVVMPATPLELPVLDVAVASRCGASGTSGQRAAALWDEVAKALTANLLTQRGRTTAVQFSEFGRIVSLGGRPLREWVIGTGVTWGVPFAALAPAELAQRGFVAEEGDSTRYAAPDAQLLLSDEFVAGHCFRSGPERGGLVGLSFRPAPGASVADVSGTLWVDRVTRELRYLEFQYVMDTPSALPAQPPIEAGGRVDFRRLPSGRWIVADWVVRMPRIASRTVNAAGNTQRELRLIGYVERGGHAGEIVDSVPKDPPAGEGVLSAATVGYLPPPGLVRRR